MRIEEMHSRFETFSGDGDERSIAPGVVISLDDKGMDERDPERYTQQYLVTSACYAASAGELASGTGESARFECSVSAVVSTRAFRPARITPKPVIQGTQTAVVVDWEEPEDNLGRVRVRFHWNTESSSCWLRVSQPLAGNKVGTLNIPRPGDEVIVSFIEGNPDRPIVLGSVYNAESPPPYKLGAERTHTGFKSLSWGSSGGSNELRFDDTDGKEEIYIHAQFNETILVENDRTETVGNDSHLTVGKDVLEEIGGKHHTAVGSDRNEDVGGSVSLNVGTDILGKAGAKVAYDAGKEIHLKAGTTLVLESGTSLSLKVGGNFISITPAGIDIKGTLVTVNTGGSAGTGSGASPEKPEEPLEAHKSEGGAANKAPEQKTAAAKANLAASGVSVPQAEIFKSAAASGTPFCEICDCPPT
jgi:type VI secretion system secreted protein VgrG